MATASAYTVRRRTNTAMPRDLHGQDPVLGYSHGNDPVVGKTTPEEDSMRRAGVILCGMAITEEIKRDELEELLLMVGVKPKVI